MIHFPSNHTLLCQRSPEERAFGALLAKEFNLPEPIGELLHSRGIQTLNQAQEYLFPHLSMLPSPENMKGMTEAIDCIMSVCTLHQPIFIHGDYDVDGISATALLVAFFREIGQAPFYYIPNRLEESYGLSFGSIDRLVTQCPGKGGVLITVDCGISAIEEMNYIKQQGLRVVVTDHHEPQDQLPLADAIVNPKQPGCTFASSSLSGVGVAFFLLIALRKAMSLSLNLKKYLDLVALGTVADVVPLQGVNRILVRAGLEVLSSKNRIGVFSICESSGIDSRDVLSEDISFRLAPRINAAGRLGCPLVGVELLLAETTETARVAANRLETMNQDRKQLEIAAIYTMEADYKEQYIANSHGIILYQTECHAGVLGILASRFVDRCQRPVIVFSDERKNGVGDFLRGSGRSVPGINLFEILEECEPLIKQFGGHAMAVGLTIHKKQLSQFKELFNTKIKRIVEQLPGTVHASIDYYLANANLLTASFSHALQRMQPFGEGNPEPVLFLAQQHLLSAKARNGHLMFQLQGAGEVLPGIGFNLGIHDFNYSLPTNLTFRLKRSWFRGSERTQVQALSITTT